MKSKIIAFDLDGTVIDSASAIVESVNQTFFKFSNFHLSNNEISSTIGRPISELFCKYANNATQLEEMLKYFRWHLGEFGHHKTNVFPGIIESINFIRMRDVRVAIATNKNTTLARTVLGKLGLENLFDYICGQDITEPKPSPKMLEFIESELKCPVIAMIGDTRDDVLTAKKHKTISIAISSGAESYKNLLTSRPDYLLNNAIELKCLLETELNL